MQKSANGKEVELDSESLQRKPSLFQRGIDFLFGYDFFISYAWLDARTYAVALAEKLEKVGFRCFLDSSEFAKGDDWRLAGGRALRKTSRLLLLLTPGALQSRPVLHEVERFHESGRTILPVDFLGRIFPEGSDPTFGGRVPGEILRINESIADLEIGPTEKMLGEVRESFNLCRQNQKRIRWLAGAAVVFAGVAGIAITAGVVAEWRRRDALSRSLASQAVIESERQLDLGMLLAADAQTVRSTDQSRSSLIRLLNLTSVEKYLHCDFVPRHVVAHPARPSLMAVAGWDGSLELWDVAAHDRLASVKTGDGELFALAISRDGTRICVGGKSAQLLIWEVIDGKEMSLRESGRVLHPDGKMIRALHFLDDHSIIVASDEPTLRQYRPTDGSWSSLPAAHTAAVSVLTRDPSGKMLVSAGSDCQVVSWELSAPDFSRRTTIRCQDWPLNIAFSADGTWMAAATHDKDVEVWNLVEGKLAIRLPLQRSGGRTFAVGFSPDGQSLYWGGDDGAINVFSFSDGRIRQQFGHSNTVFDLCWTTDGRRFVTTGRDRKITIWNPQRLSALERERARFTSEGGWITASAHSERRKMILLGDERGNVRLFDAAEMLLKDVQSAHVGTLSGILALDGDAADFVTTGADQKVAWWRVADGKLKPVGNSGESPAPLRALLGGTEGVPVFGVTVKGAVFRCDPKTSSVTPVGQCFAVEPVGQPPPVFAIHPKKPVIAAASRTDLVLFDCERGTSIATPKSVEYFSKIHFSSDGRELLCALGTEIEIRDSKSGIPRASMQIGRVPPSEWVVANDGTLLCADTEGRLTWWNLGTRVQIGPGVKLPAADCSALFFSSSRQTFFSMERSFHQGQNHYVVRDWQADPEKWTKLARSIANRRFTELEAERFGR